MGCKICSFVLLHYVVNANFSFRPRTGSNLIIVSFYHLQLMLIELGSVSFLFYERTWLARTLSGNMGTYDKYDSTKA